VVILFSGLIKLDVLVRFQIVLEADKLSTARLGWLLTRNELTRLLTDINTGLTDTGMASIAYKHREISLWLFLHLRLVLASTLSRSWQALVFYIYWPATVFTWSSYSLAPSPHRPSHHPPSTYWPVHSVQYSLAAHDLPFDHPPFPSTAFFYRHQHRLHTLRHTFPRHHRPPVSVAPRSSSPWSSSSRHSSMAPLLLTLFFL
jgi:hypothetical protein